MIPTKHARSLYFTPRTPWGRYPQHRPGQNYLRASETAPTDPDKKPGLSGKELQGLAGGMAPNQFGGPPGQAGGAADLRSMVPQHDPRDYQVPQQPKAPDRAEMERARRLAELQKPTPDLTQRLNNSLNDQLNKQPEGGIPLPWDMRLHPSFELEQKPGEKREGELELEFEKKFQRK